VQVFQQEADRVLRGSPADQRREGGEQTGLRGRGVEFRCVRCLAFQQPLKVRDVGLEHACFEVVGVRQEREPAQDFAPELVGQAAFPHRLAAQDERALHQRAGAQFVQQAGFAHPALAAHQPGAPLPPPAEVEYLIDLTW